MKATGERQVSPTLDGIRRDHVARYEFAAERLAGKSVIDCACGIGYGAKIMADAGAKVKAIDIDQDAILYGLAHYDDNHITHVVADAQNIGPFSGYDAIVSFETIEHIEDPLPVLKRYARSVPQLICSVPNEDVLPHQGKVKYHYRHYTPEQFEFLLNRSGWQIDEWHGQAGPESEVEPNLPGRTLIAVCSLNNRSDGGTWKKLPVAQKIPESVAIVAMGRSSATYLSLASHNGNRKKVADETWAINSMGGVIQHDLLFHMDDCKVQESRVDTNDNVAGMLDWLKTHPRFMTIRVP
jgi:SAM-dependent methyltransferase